MTEKQAGKKEQSSKQYSFEVEDPRRLMHVEAKTSGQSATEKAVVAFSDCVKFIGRPRGATQAAVASAEVQIFVAPRSNENEDGKSSETQIGSAILYRGLLRIYAFLPERIWLQLAPKLTRANVCYCSVQVRSGHVVSMTFSN